MSRGDELAALSGSLRRHLDAAHAAREKALVACRRTIRSCGSSIRAVHGLDMARAGELADEAESSLREAQEALRPHPALAAAGPLPGPCTTPRRNTPRRASRLPS
ncbi:MAG: hypothetical protein LC733_06765 [Actinobacteria bacterium]|nr:hypothetical protein [Actinomycetota bacterium]